MIGVDNKSLKATQNFQHGISIGKAKDDLRPITIRNNNNVLEFVNPDGSDATVKVDISVAEITSATITTLASTSITATTVNSGTLELQGSSSTLDLTFDDTGALLGTDYVVVSDETTSTVVLPINAGVDITVDTIAITINGTAYTLLTSTWT